LLSPTQIVDTLNSLVTSASFYLNSKSQVRLGTHSRGSLSSIFIRGADSTAASILGLPVDRSWRGKDIVPSWTIVSDPTTLADRPTRLIVFDTPLKGYTDYVEVTYTTVRQECRRCGGLGIEHDWRYNGRGDVVQVQGQDLLLQEVMKIVYTVLGSNRFHTWYGTNVVNAIGKKLTSTGIVQNMILNEVSDAFRRWQTVKRQQEENIGQVVTDEEFPYRLSAVNLQQSDSDPTVIIVNTLVQNRSNKTIELTRAVKAPLPIDLLGSTQQQQIFNQTTPNYQLVQS
jgi:phage baseplate assembly protein W